MNRSGFLAGGVTAAAAVAFLRGVALGASGSAAAVELDALIETILPLKAAGFPPISAPSITERINKLYALDEDARFVGSLGAFAKLASFSTGTRQLLEAEKAASRRADLEALIESDATAFETLALPQVHTFAQLGDDQRARYLLLWQNSAFSVRRRFYGSVRAIAFIAFYSMPEAWKAIGYGGPLLTKNGGA